MPTTTLSQEDTGKFFAYRSKGMAALGKDSAGWGDYWIGIYYDAGISNSAYNAIRTVYLNLEDKADNSLLEGNTPGSTPTTFDIDADPNHPAPPIRH